MRVLDSGSGLLADGMTALTGAVRTWTLVLRMLSRNLPGKAPCPHSTHARSEMPSRLDRLHIALAFRR
jgi:hypothetical protein